MTALPHAGRATPTLALLASAIGGLALGGLTLVLQGTLPGAWNQLGNSGAVWSVGAFAAGAAILGSRRLTAIAGLIVLFGAVIGYYASTTLFLHQDLTSAALRGPEVWLGVACVAGPVFGIAGWAYRQGSERGRLLGIASLGAVFLAEAAYLLVVLRYWGSATILGVIGLAIPLALGRSTAARLRGYATLVPLTVAGAVALGAVYELAQVAF